MELGHRGPCKERGGFEKLGLTLHTANEEKLRQMEWDPSSSYCFPCCILDDLEDIKAAAWATG